MYNRIPHTTPKGYIVIKDGGFITKELWKVVTDVSALIAAVASVISLILQICRDDVLDDLKVTDLVKRFFS